MHDHVEHAWELRLELDGLLERSQRGLHTTERWHTALARAAFRLFHNGEELSDIRIPIAAALADNYPAIDKGTLAAAVRVMFPVAVGELSAFQPTRCHDLE